MTTKIQRFYPWQLLIIGMAVLILIVSAIVITSYSRADDNPEAKIATCDFYATQAQTLAQYQKDNPDAPQVELTELVLGWGERESLTPNTITLVLNMVELLYTTNVGDVPTDFARRLRNECMRNL